MQVLPRSSNFSFSPPPPSLFSELSPGKTSPLDRLCHLPVPLHGIRCHQCGARLPDSCGNPDMSSTYCMRLNDAPHFRSAIKSVPLLDVPPLSTQCTCLAWVGGNGAFHTSGLRSDQRHELRDLRLLTATILYRTAQSHHIPVRGF